MSKPVASKKTKAFTSKLELTSRVKIESPLTKDVLEITLNDEDIPKIKKWLTKIEACEKVELDIKEKRLLRYILEMRKHDAKRYYEGKTRAQELALVEHIRKKLGV